jgi:hypothetical protein
MRQYQSLKNMTEEERQQRLKDQRKASYERNRDRRNEYNRQYYKRLKELAAVGALTACI